MSDANLSWDSEVSQESEFTLMPDNTEVSFEVVNFERALTKKGAPMAKLTLKCVNPESNAATTVKDTLVLMRSCEWKICQFFTCIGLRKHGDKGVPNWEAVVGAKGTARLGVDEWQSQNGDTFESNTIKTYLAPADESNPF